MLNLNPNLSPSALPEIETLHQQGVSNHDYFLHNKLIVSWEKGQNH